MKRPRRGNSWGGAVVVETRGMGGRRNRFRIESAPRVAIAARGQRRVLAEGLEPNLVSVPPKASEPMIEPMIEPMTSGMRVVRVLAGMFIRLSASSGPRPKAYQG
jgi:hypothetical protein